MLWRSQEEIVMKHNVLGGTVYWFPFYPPLYDRAEGKERSDAEFRTPPKSWAIIYLTPEPKSFTLDCPSFKPYFFDSFQIFHAGIAMKPLK